LYALTVGGMTGLIAGQCAEHAVNWSLSYIDDVQTALYIKLPDAMSGYLASYAQFPANNSVLTGVSDGGIYTAIPLTIMGLNVPANSLYWTSTNTLLGTSKKYSFKMCSIPGTQSGVWYELS